MKNKHKSLDKRQLLRKQGVEEDCDGNCRDREQYRMPRLRDVVALVEDYKALYL